MGKLGLNNGSWRLERVGYSIKFLPNKYEDLGYILKPREKQACWSMIAIPVLRKWLERPLGLMCQPD